MQIHHVRRGSGKPLLLVPGLGATWQSWDTVLDALAREDTTRLILTSNG